jgi:CheY-like chemotaxis protein
MMMAEASDKRILIVEDEEDVLRYLAAILEDEGFEVATATDGDRALHLVEERAPDLISLDLVMPGKSGIKFLYALRRNREWARIPVLIVTGHAHDEKGKGDLDDIMAGRVVSGPAFYLEKPVRPDAYVAAVSRQLGIEVTEAEEAPEEEKAEKAEAQKLLEGADPETLAQVLKLLKKDGGD